MNNIQLAPWKRVLPPNGRRHPLIIAVVLPAGGTGKTTSTVNIGTTLALRGYTVRVFDMDAQCNTSTTLNAGPKQLPEGAKTVWHLINGEVEFNEVTTQARYWNGDPPADWDPEVDGEYEEYSEIPNLYIVPGDPEMKNCDVHMTSHPDAFHWFWELIGLYKSGEIEAVEDEVWILDMPANFGRLTVSVLIGMDENDEVLPTVLVTSKEEEALYTTRDRELPGIAQRYRQRATPARPTMHHVLLCGTPTKSHDASEYRRTVAEIEENFKGMLLPYVRYSSVVTSQYRRRCPVVISDPHQRPAKDYGAVADALGFKDKEAAAT